MPCWPGRGGSGEQDLGLRTRRARTVQVMVPTGSGSSPPMQRRLLPHSGPTGTPKRERPPGPPHQGPQGQHIHNPLPLPKETEKAGNGARRPARQLLGTPAQARPPKGRRRAQAGAPRPLRAALRRRAGPRLSGWRLEGPRRRGTARVTGSAQRPADSRCPHRLSPLACHRPN